MVFSNNELAPRMNYPIHKTESVPVVSEMGNYKSN